MLIKKNRSMGFILPLAMIIIFSITAVIVRLMTRVTVNLPLKTMVLEREQAKQVALMGVNIVRAQLTGCVKESKKRKEWLEQFLSILNSWQTYTLQEKSDGIEGTIQIYVSSEEGKIPLNAFWDFKNKKFVEKNIVDVKALLGSLVLAQQGGKPEEQRTSASSMLEALEKVLKNVDDPLEDITQLLTEELFKRLTPVSPDDTLFAPPRPKNSQEKTKTHPDIILGDLFTITHTDATIQPVLFSSSVKAILELQQVGESEKQKESLKNMVEKLKDPVNWSKQWDELLAKSYGKTYDKLSPALTKIFHPSVEASSLKSLISVVSYGKVGNVTQKVLALVSPELDSNNCVVYNIRKLYWL